MDLDTLWRVEDEFLRVPQWSTTVSPGERNAKAGGLSPEPKRSSGGRKTLQITDGNDSDPASMRSSMPDLEVASDYSADSAMRGRADESEAESLDSEGEESSEYD
jgi:hypothetical protein